MYREKKIYIIFQSKAFPSNLEMYLQGVEISKLSSVCLYGGLERAGVVTSSWEQTSSDSEVKQVYSLANCCFFFQVKLLW